MVEVARRSRTPQYVARSTTTPRKTPLLGDDVDMMMIGLISDTYARVISGDWAHPLFRDLDPQTGQGRSRQEREHPLRPRADRREVPPRHGGRKLGLCAAPIVFDTEGNIMTASTARLAQIKVRQADQVAGTARRPARGRRRRWTPACLRSAGDMLHFERIPERRAAGSSRAQRYKVVTGTMGGGQLVSNSEVWTPWRSTQTSSTPLRSPDRPATASR